MTKEEALAQILTSEFPQINQKLKEAFEAGMAYEDTVVEHRQYQEYAKLARSIIRQFDCTPEEAVAVFGLGKKASKPLLKILRGQLRQKPISKKSENT